MGLLRALNLRPPVGGDNAQTRSSDGPGVAATADKNGRLLKAAETWRQTHRQADERIRELKKSIESHYAQGHPDLLREIDSGLAKLDEVLKNVDHRLADSLASAGGAKHEAAQNVELRNAKSIFAEYISYVNSADLIAHMDRNPFGVNVGLKKLLAEGLTSAAKAIG